MKPALKKLAIAASLFTAIQGFCAGSPLDGLSKLKDYRAMRASSFDLNWENGNADARTIGPGETITIAELEGPGKIVHIWFTIAHSERFYGKLMVLRIYWDGEKHPSVECPINDFFCQGHGLDVNVNSFPIRVTSDGRARNCYWPMPFRKSAKMTITNESKHFCNAFYYYVDWQKYDKLPADEAYFHAQYRQEYPCTQGIDYLILDAKGRGHFVGCNLSVRQREPHWWGEGDDRFYIDGEKIPSLHGTGSEDYFCDAWGIRKLDGLYYGFPISEGYNTLDKHTCYRFHIQDPVPFNKSLKVYIEHKGARLMPDGKLNGYAERADDFSSVAYWYQTEPHKPFPKLPSGYDRLYKNNSIVIEGEDLVKDALAEPNSVQVQELHGLTSNNKQLFFTPKEAPSSISVKFNVPKSGKYMLFAHLVRSWDYGIYQAFLNGQKASSPMDLYSDTVSPPKSFRLGIFDLNAGQHELKFETEKKNSLSEGYFLGLDYLELVTVE